MANKHGLVRPGIVGRLVRLVFAAATFSLTWALFTDLRTMLDGDLPIDRTEFWVTMVLMLFTTGWVVTETVGRRWGQRPLFVAIGIVLLVAIVDLFVSANLFGSLFTTALWVWGVALTVPLALAFLVAAIIGQPGCEMRSFAAIGAMFRKQDPRAAACPGGIDMFDHIGSPDLK